MKEKIWIEKLIELLNEYEQEEWCWGLKYWKLHNKYYDDYDQKDEEIRLISKWYGFIKWLVENNKINKDLISRVLIRAYVSPKTMVSLECEFYDYYESLLMLLSISDTPIEDLVSYLR